MSTGEGAGLVCVSVCSHCANVFPVATSVPTPSFPHLSPSQNPAFGVHRHLIPKLVRARGWVGAPSRGRTEPHHYQVTPRTLCHLRHLSKLFDLWTCLLPRFRGAQDRLQLAPSSLARRPAFLLENSREELVDLWGLSWAVPEGRVGPSSPSPTL